MVHSKTGKWIVAVVTVLALVGWFLIWNGSPSDATVNPAAQQVQRKSPHYDERPRGKTAFVVIKKKYTTVRSVGAGRKVRQVKQTYCLGQNGYPTSRANQCASTRKSVCKPYPARETYVCATGKSRPMTRAEKAVIECGGYFVIGVIGGYFTGGTTAVALTAGGGTSAAACGWGHLFK